MGAKKKKGSSGAGFPLAAGVIAGIAGTYFLYGTSGATNRKKIKGWVIKAKGEAIEKMEKMKELDEASYHALIDGVTQKYGKVKGIEQNEIHMLVKDLKKHWKNIAREAQGKKKPTRKTAKIKLPIEPILP